MIRGDRWRPAILTTQLAVAAILLGSWFSPMTRPLWDHLDAAAFHLLHGSVVTGSDPWRLFWAATNTRLFDAVSAVVFAIVFLSWVVAGGWARLPDRIAAGVLLTLVTVLVLHVSSNIIFTFERLSPSLVLEPVFRLSPLIEGVKVKDQSGNSFPGDHGTAVVHFAAFIWAFCGRTRGLVALAVALFVVMPRMMGGAHWITDLLVGSASIALVSTALLLATPLAGLLVAFIARPLAAIASALARRGLAPEALKRPAAD